MTRSLRLIDIRRRWRYVQGLALQKQVQESMLKAHRVNGDVPPDTLILQEHESIYTLGRRSDIKNVLYDVNSGEFELFRSDRGGEVTFHGPGQIVGYSVLDLRRHEKDLHWYTRQLEEVIILTLSEYGLQAERKEKYTGVWVGNAKVCAIGLNASNWITSHGFAFNVNTDLGWFERIVPCGINDETLSVASLTTLLGEHKTNINRSRVQEKLAKNFMKVFKFEKAQLEVS